MWCVFLTMLISEMVSMLAMSKLMPTVTGPSEEQRRRVNVTYIRSSAIHHNSEKPWSETLLISADGVGSMCFISSSIFKTVSQNDVDDWGEHAVNGDKWKKNSSDFRTAGSHHSFSDTYGSLYAYFYTWFDGLSCCPHASLFTLFCHHDSHSWFSAVYRWNYDSREDAGFIVLLKYLSLWIRQQNLTRSRLFARDVSGKAIYSETSSCEKCIML